MERAVVMTGLGGQGVQLLAKLLAEAGIPEGRQVMMFGIFMGMIRGGSSESTVVLADDEIVSPPIVPEFWGVLAMHPEGLAKLAPKVRAGGVLVRNATMVTRAPAWDGVRDVAVPATELAKAMGQPLGASMIALGAPPRPHRRRRGVAAGRVARHGPAAAPPEAPRVQPRVPRARRRLARRDG